jgi:hypothetical protein
MLAHAPGQVFSKSASKQLELVQNASHWPIGTSVEFEQSHTQLRHEGQSTVPPHPSGIEVPHSYEGHVVGVHPHTPDVPPPPQLSGAVHPQSSVPPHPSSSEPQLGARSAHVFGVQQTSPKQVWPVGQEQLSVPPQASGTLPQLGAWAAQVVGVQHVPKTAFPCCSTGFMHRPLQQLAFV